MNNTTDFTAGRVSTRILQMALPLMLAQLVQLLYNLVDRIYIGHMEAGSSLAVSGLGLTFPIVTLIAAFTLLLSGGSSPLFSMELGRKHPEKAAVFLNATFWYELFASGILLLICWIFMAPIMRLFGASERTLPYALAYLRIYLLGTPMLMLASGLNPFLSAQGFAKTAMITTVSGALLNLLLDPLFIFGFSMGIAGAALATVLSQAVSLLWVLLALRRRRCPIRLQPNLKRLKQAPAGRILALGLPGFVMQASNALVQIACNQVLFTWGGDLYVGIMTLLNALREVVVLPAMGLTNGAQPVISYTYGAGKSQRLRECIRFMTISSLVITALCWGLLALFPGPLLALFTSDQQLISQAVPCLQIYFFGFVFMALQFAGQTVFTALGQARQAIFFSLFRKVLIVVPLTWLLPHWFGVAGVFAAEPVSNVVGGLACYITMRFHIRKLLSRLPS